jgi:hypothetical protein
VRPFQPLRRPHLAFVAIVAVLVYTGTAAASVVPTSLSVGAGFTKNLDPREDRVHPVPTLAATWTLGTRWSLRSSVGYLRDRLPRDFVTTGFTTFPVKYSQFVPLAVGIRSYPWRAVGGTRGIFVDAAPALFISQVENYFAPTWNTVRWGYHAGVGFRFSIAGKSRGEIGAAIYHIDGTEQSSVKTDSSDGRPFGGKDTYTFNVLFGWGD